MYLQPCVGADRQLLLNLSLHLRTTLNRIRLGLPIHNPLLNDIRRQYPYVFQVARRAASVLEELEGASVPDEEVGYIAMHLGAAMERFRASAGTRSQVLVVCGEGTATAWLLVSRLRAEFPQVEIVEVTSAASLSEERVHELGVCAVVSTVAIPSSPVPVIRVSPLLDAQDMASIRGGLAQACVAVSPSSRPWTLSGHPLSDLLCEDAIALQVPASDWEGVVEAAGSLLSDVGAIEPPYVQAMKNLIHDHGPYVVIMPGVALLHAHPGAWVRRVCLSLVTLRDPVSFGHPRHDPVCLAVALSTTDGRSHWRALRQLVELLNDSSALEQITSSCSREEVLQVLTREEQGAEHCNTHFWSQLRGAQVATKRRGRAVDKPSAVG